MLATVPRLRRDRGRRSPLLVLLLAAALVSGACGDAAPPASPGSDGSLQPAPPSVIPPATAAAPVASPSGGPSATTGPASGTSRLAPGALAVTVTGGLRVRSQPRVSRDSLKYAPLLGDGTQLVVTGGPVKASGYTWIRVAPVGVQLRGGSGKHPVAVDQGWVAIADHDGTPWVGVADDPTPGFELVSASVARPKPALAAAREAATAQNAFGIGLYRAMLADPALELDDRSVVMSPTSVMMALAMARAGANGDTAAGLDRLLRLEGWERYASGLAALDQRLRSRDATWGGDRYTEPHLQALRMANQVFGQQGFHIQPAYLDRVGAAFGAPLALTDFSTDPEAARDAINGWVSRQTLGRIPKLLGPGTVSETTRLVLVNAIYLKAQWAQPLWDTVKRPFTTMAGRSVTVPTMREYQAELPVASGNGWRATELPYLAPPGQPGLAMVVILPDDIDAFQRALSPALLDRIDARLDREWDNVMTVTYGNPNRWGEDCGSVAYRTSLFMPRFGIDTAGNLVPALIEEGIGDGVTDAADFSGVTGGRDLSISFVIHQANIDVDEEGTEAAAATAVGMDTTGGCGGPRPEEVRTLRLNRPFLFLLRDQETGAILFLGRVADPSVR